jgi:hypothetical protein
MWNLLLVCYLDNNLGSGSLYVAQVVLSHSLVISTNRPGNALEHMTFSKVLEEREVSCTTTSKTTNYFQ